MRNVLMKLVVAVVAVMALTASTAVAAVEVRPNGSTQPCPALPTGCVIHNFSGQTELYIPGQGSLGWYDFTSDSMSFGGDGAAQVWFPKFEPRPDAAIDYLKACDQGEPYPSWGGDAWPVEIEAAGGGQFTAVMTMCLEVDYSGEQNYHEFTFDITSHSFGIMVFEQVGFASPGPFQNGVWWSDDGDIDLIEVP